MSGAENVKTKKPSKYILGSTYSDLGWVNKKPHESPGRKADGAPEANTPKSDQVALETTFVFAKRWLKFHCSNRG